MIYLVLAIMCSALLSVIMRLSEGKASGNSMLAVNYLTCLIVAALLTGPQNFIPQGNGAVLTLAMGLFNGFLYLLGFVVFHLNIRRNGLVMSATFMKLGLLVPMVVSIFLFGEKPAFLQIIGFILAIGAILLINLEKGESTLSFKAGLILLLLSGGSADAMSKIFEELGNHDHSAQFLLFTFLSAFLLCVLLVMKNNEKPCKADLLYGVALGIPNYFSALFLLKALGSVKAVVVYPTFSVGTIVTVSLVSVLFFREKLAKRQILALGIILVALILLNI